jgi:hypothetical protein
LRNDQPISASYWWVWLADGLTGSLIPTMCGPDQALILAQHGRAVTKFPDETAIGVEVAPS